MLDVGCCSSRFFIYSLFYSFPLPVPFTCLTQMRANVCMRVFIFILKCFAIYAVSHLYSRRSILTFNEHFELHFFFFILNFLFALNTLVQMCGNSGRGGQGIALENLKQTLWHEQHDSIERKAMVLDTGTNFTRLQFERK